MPSLHHLHRAQHIFSTSSSFASFGTISEITTSSVLFIAGAIAMLNLVDKEDKVLQNASNGLKSVLTSVLLYAANFNHYMAREVTERRGLPQWDMIPATAVGSLIAVGAMR